MNQKMKFLFASFALLFFATLTYAQPGGGNMTAEERAQRQTDHMAETLALSDAQKEKIQEVNLTYAKKMEEARKEADGDWSAMRETMRTLRAEGQEELKKYLTEEQSEKWEKVQMERREKRGDRGNREKNGKPRNEKPENGE